MSQPPRPQSGMPGGGPRARLIPLLATAFLVLMGVAWLMSTPPGSAFDERAHYIKAIGVGRGELYGQAPAVKRQDLDALFKLGSRNEGALKQLAGAVASPQVRWQARTRREFHVPPTLIDPGFGCTAESPEVTGACLEKARPSNRQRLVSSYVGSYQPYLYVPAGLAIRLADDPDTALRLGRAATLALAVLLLIGAVWLLWTPRAPGVSLLGLAVAVTPMVMYVASVLSPSGPEIAGAICFSAALLRLGRAEPQPRWLWGALAGSGAALAASRALGPAFVVALLVAAALLIGPGTLMRTIRAGGRRAAAAAGVVLVAVAASAIWEFSYQPRPSPGRTGVIDAIDPSISHLPGVGDQAIGVFGKLDAHMPTWGTVVWAILFVALVAAALAAGRDRDRLAIIGLLCGAVVAILVMSVVYREIGPLHGRYALPLLVLVPLWAGEVVLRRRARLSARLVLALSGGTFAAAAAVNLLAWLASSRRFAVGQDGGWLFFRDAEWAPPLGWWPWLLMAVAAAGCYLAAGALSVAMTARARSSRGAPARQPVAHAGGGSA